MLTIPKGFRVELPPVLTMPKGFRVQAG